MSEIKECLEDTLVDRIGKIIYPGTYEAWNGTFDAVYPETIRLRDRDILQKKIDAIRDMSRLVIAEMVSFQYPPTVGLDFGPEPAAMAITSIEVDICFDALPDYILVK